MWHKIKLIIEATEMIEKMRRLSMAKEAKEKDDTRRMMAAKPPQKCQEVDSDEELLAATLQLEQLQCGQAEEEHHQHAQAQGQGQGEHQEGGEHH